MMKLFHRLLAVALLSGPMAAWCADGDQAPASAAQAAEVAITPEQLLSLISGDLQTRFNLVGDLQLDFANNWTAPGRLAKSWRVAIVEYPAGAGSSMVVRFRLFADTVNLGETSVALRASLWRDAWFAREPLDAGGGLDRNLIEGRRIDFFRIHDAVPTDEADPDLILTRGVPAGSMVSWHDLGHKPLVRKGELVDVSATMGLLTVTMKGLALQSGAKGDLVTVRNPESLKTIPGVVVGENRVEVRL